MDGDGDSEDPSQHIEQPQQHHPADPIPQKLQGQGEHIDDQEQDNQGRPACNPDFHLS